MRRLFAPRFAPLRLFPVWRRLAAAKDVSAVQLGCEIDVLCLSLAPRLRAWAFAAADLGRGLSQEAGDMPVAAELVSFVRFQPPVVVAFFLPLLSSLLLCQPPPEKI